MGGRVSDRISALYDDLIDHILSYLPTKEAVQTSVLSKRWKKLWASVSVLTFDFSEFCCMENETPLLDKCNDKFVKFVDYVLASRKGQQIDRFMLVWGNQTRVYPGNAHPVRRWISLVLLQKPQVLSIYVQPSEADVEIVPDMVFTCSSLEEMKLQIPHECWPQVLEPKLVNLLSLKRLNLGYITIKADFMSKLLLGCPKLEELELYVCGLNFSQIYCGNLKSLVLDCCCPLQEIRVSISSLQYLKVTLMSSDTPGSFVFENMSSLVKACVCFFTEGDCLTQFYSGEAKILNNLSRVTNLDIVLHGSQAAGMLKHALNNCPYFENLKAVHFENFDVYLSNCMDVIDRLVQHSPILEKFSFYCCEDLSDENKDELRKIVCEHGNCQIIQQSNQGHIYQSVREVEKLLLDLFRLHMTESTDDDDDDDNDDDGGGGGGGDDGDDDEDAGGDGGGVGGEGDVEQ